VSGGSWSEIESHAYLIEADAETVRIQVEQENDRYFE
jgi:hypothetical protein